VWLNVFKSPFNEGKLAVEMDAINGAGAAYLSRIPEFTPVLVEFVLFLIFSFLCSVL
jgi:hypothetical protein